MKDFLAILQVHIPIRNMHMVSFSPLPLCMTVRIGLLLISKKD